MKHLRWCENCQLPLIGEKCDSCGRTGKIMKPDIRPIFINEKINLEKDFNCKLPFPLFYGSSGWLYAKGNAIGRMSIKEGKPCFSPSSNYENVAQTSDLSMAEFKEKAIAANISALSTNETEAILFINSTIKDFPQYKPVVAFSGGKDSTVSAALVQRAIGQTTLFFGDTTIEFPDTYKYLNEIARNNNFKLIKEQPPKNFHESVEKLGPPSQSLRWCCTVVKASPLNNFLFKNKDHCLFFDGIRRRESTAREDYERITGNKKSVNQIVARPILEWTTMDIWLYIWWRNLNYNSLYDKGYGRAGCMYCPNNTKYDSYLTSIYFPKEHSKWNDELEKYFIASNDDKKFTKKEKDFWINYGWKHRLPHRKKIFVGKRYNWNSERSEIEFDSPIDENFIDFIVPTGNVFVSGREFISTSSNYKIEGKIGHKKIKIKGNGSRQLSKAINKYLNCFGCGACVGSCPFGAIYIDKEKLRVDIEKCNKCEVCLGSKFLGSGCVSLTYKSECNTVRDVDEMTHPIIQPQIRN